eukprot:TRINITY_DN8289_c0_g1_i1.p1 TRINITY_DN8289_c0_g1~~TRINITY_DN8289_c0_g1_i1.p1  ORF type:complete len:356 (+),score=42.72 TRINITY_DN8289_c0_g1_i1:462-1529(+)
MNPPQPDSECPPTLVDLLPLELISEISSHLDAQSVCRLSQSCRPLHYLSTDESIWRHQLCSAYSDRWRDMISDTEYGSMERQFSRKSWLGSVEKLPGLHKQLFIHLQTPLSKLKRLDGQLDYSHLVRLITLGSSGVGKSALLTRYTDNTYMDWMIPNIGIDFKIRTFEPINPETDFGGQVKHVKAQLWDTAGQERFRQVSSAYYRGVHAFILAYAVDDRHSYDEIISRWMPAVKNFGQEGARVVVAACKCDLPRDQWKVSKIEGRLLASQLGCSFVETSSKDNINVDLLFGHAATIALEYHLSKTAGQQPRVVPVPGANNNMSVWSKFATWITSSWPFSRISTTSYALVKADEAK